MISISLTPSTYQYISQLGLMRQISANSATSVESDWLVPANGWHNGQRLPYNVAQDLSEQKFETTVVEGIEYYKVPEESTNLPGLLSHYAQRTGVADLKNAPGGGVNRVAETLAGDAANVTVAPDAVSKYVETTDNYEEARKKVSESEQLVARQVTVTPAREPANGDLVVTAEDASAEEKPARKTPAPKKAE